MRKVILYINVTLDGFIAGPNGELDWMLPDPEMNWELSNALRERVDTIVTGRNFYHAVEQIFRAQAADPANPPELVDFANWMIDTPKVVFSTGLSTVVDGSRLASGDLRNEVEALKAEPGRDVVLFGGVDIVQQFVQQRLVDEYWVKLYPLAIGVGQPLFTGLGQRADLELVDNKAYASGILALRYVPGKH